MRRRSKIQVIWRFLVVISMLINAFQLQGRIVKAFYKQPAVKRFAIMAMIDGIKYRVFKK